MTHASGVKTAMSQTTLIQRLEGLVVLVTAMFLYAAMGASWWLFVLLLFMPDLSMVGYWAGNRIGQISYNIVHAYVLPLALALIGFSLGQSPLLAIGLIWLAHIGLDRAVGYGLKEAEGFKFTHLGAL